MAFTLAQLRTPQTKADFVAAILSKLAADGVDTSSWAPSAQGGIEMANVEAVAAELATFAATTVVTTTNAGFLDYATGQQLELHALERYQIVKRFAQATIQSITLVVKPNAPSQDFPTGQVWFRSDAGRLYRNTAAVSIKSDPALASQNKDTKIFVQAACTVAGAAANADIGGSITTLVTPAFPGVTCINDPPAKWTAAVVAGSYAGAGTVTLDGIPTDGTTVVKIRVDASGDAEAGAFSYSFDGGQTYASGGVLHSGKILPNSIVVSFTAGTARPAFTAGAVYSFARADAIVQRGTDDETDEALRKRCRNRWPSLSAVPTAGLVDLWAHEASPEVDRVLVQADELHAGWMNVRISAVDGMPSLGAVQAVQDYITARLNADSGGLEFASVSAVDVLPIVVRTSIFVPVAQLATVQAAAQAAWIKYLQSVPIGGKVLYARFIQIVMDAGAVDTDEQNTYFNAIHIDNADFLQLGAVQVAAAGPFGGVPAGLLADTVNWLPV